MSIFGLLQPRTPLLAGDEPTSHNSEDVASAEAVLAAAKRVSKKFGVATSSHELNAALTAARSQTHYVDAFKMANISVIDSATVLTYRSERLKPTRLERFHAGKITLKQAFEKYLLHREFLGIVSAVISYFTIFPALVSLIISLIFHQPNFFLNVLGTQVAVSACVAFFAWVESDYQASQQRQLKSKGERVDKNEPDVGWEMIISHGKFYARCIYAMLWWPLLQLVTLTVGWFWKTDSGRSWQSVLIKDYQKLVPDAVILTIDRVIGALPKASLELEILHPSSGDKDELFVTLPLGGTTDKLYLWHELAV